MAYGISSRDITPRYYQIQHQFTGSSRVEEGDISEILDSLFANKRRRRLLKEPFFYRNFPQLFEIDVSSEYPHFEVKSKTTSIEEVIDEIILEEMLEFDVFVRMPPVKEYTVRVKIKSVEKAIPHIVEPEGI